MNDPPAIAKGTVQYGPQQAHVYGQDESKGVLLMPLNLYKTFNRPTVKALLEPRPLNAGKSPS